MKVHVGGSKKIFYVHRKLLCDISDVFTAALRPGHFLEDATETIDVSDVDIETFNYFTEWLYSGRFSGMCLGGLAGPTSNAGACSFNFSRILHLYVFADKYMIAQLKREAVKSFYRHTRFHKGPDTSVMAFVYRETPSKSPLRCLVTAFLTSCNNLKQIAEERWAPLMAHPELLMDVISQQCDGYRERNKNPFYVLTEDAYLKSLEVETEGKAPSPSAGKFSVSLSYTKTQS